MDYPVRGDHSLDRNALEFPHEEKQAVAMPMTDTPGTFQSIREYVSHLSDPAPYWRVQAAAWGIILVVVMGAGGLFTFIGLASVYGGGSIAYEAKGSPGPVVFRHWTHMRFENGKYEDCKTCHDRLFAAQTYGTFVLRALRDSPSSKVRIGKDASTLYVPGQSMVTGQKTLLATYPVPRACRTCATGRCHDGKESFSRLECLKCHQRM